MRLNSFLWLAILLLTLTGCASLAPDYNRPEFPVGENWPTTRTEPATPEHERAEVPWREFFVDPQLRRLIELALVNNRDLRVAALNIERYQALYQIRRADRFPQLDASATGRVQRLPADLSSSGRASTSHQYIVGLGVSAYELDLFGRVRSLKESALQQYLATEQAQRGVQIGLVSQVAAGYLTLVADRERLRLAKETLASQQSSYQLIRSRFDAGVSSALDLHQAQTGVAAAQVDVARFTSLVAQDENALTLLVGAPVPAGEFPAVLADNLTFFGDVTPGLPSEVLLSRPDVQQAEADLKGANANIGAARANFFPRISLTGSLGTGSSELSGLFGADSLTWNFAPQVTLPLFDAGSNRANLTVAEVDRDLAVARYEKAIQSAFREVADALTQRGTIDDQIRAQQALTDATAETYQLSRTRYEKGVDSYLNVLDSQRSFYGAQQNLISVRLARLNNLVTLYKVLGGGGS